MPLANSISTFSALSRISLAVEGVSWLATLCSMQSSLFGVLPPTAEVLTIDRPEPFLDLAATLLLRHPPLTLTRTTRLRIVCPSLPDEFAEGLWRRSEIRQILILPDSVCVHVARNAEIGKKTMCPLWTSRTRLEVVPRDVLSLATGAALVNRIVHWRLALPLWMTF